MAFDFTKEAQNLYNGHVQTMLLKDIYNSGKSKKSTSGASIYALYFHNKLMKIGKAVCGKGLFTRMSQYYRGKKDGSKKITNLNRDQIDVKFFFLDKNKCWIAERKLQVLAWDADERMPWECKTRN